MWFDPLTDIFFRPFIRTPRQGAATAICLLLDEEAGKRTGTLNVSCRPKVLSEKYTHHFRPFIRTPRQGAATAICLLLDEEAGKRTGTLNVSCRPKVLSEKYTHHSQSQELWNRTEEIVAKWL